MGNGSVDTATVAPRAISIGEGGGLPDFLSLITTRRQWAHSPSSTPRNPSLSSLGTGDVHVAAGCGEGGWEGCGEMGDGGCAGVGEQRREVGWDWKGEELRRTHHDCFSEAAQADEAAEQLGKLGRKHRALGPVRAVGRGRGTAKPRCARERGHESAGFVSAGGGAGPMGAGKDAWCRSRFGHPPPTCLNGILLYTVFSWDFGLTTNVHCFSTSSR